MENLLNESVIQSYNEKRMYPTTIEKDAQHDLQLFLNHFENMSLNEEQRDLLNERTSKLKEMIKDNYHSYLNATTMPSILIAGASNYNVKKNQREMERQRTILDTYNIKLEKFISNTKKMIAAKKTENEKYQELIDWIHYNCEKIKAAKMENDRLLPFYKKSFSDSLIRKIKKSNTEQLKVLREGFISEKMDAFYTKRHSIHKLLAEGVDTSQTNNYINEKISKLHIDGAVIKQNKEIDRLQIIFNEIPSHEVRTLLKRFSFKWSPNNNAWQRKLTLNAVNALHSLITLMTKEEG
ncbi:hypothetical protein [Listeria seeligeri]|uniref:hypothetical protein n=1 Tax=Listeria seeligeri TaxID=1640 RepID=UPI0016285288|nr:hypothetical protein [Listeria seeligeri]MBC1556994.1 hypothetical protein [Listeria seeligeri]HAB0718285.1 hypothetical protein [Listeria monocytogenes]